MVHSLCEVKWSCSQRRKLERWLPGAGGGGDGESVFKGDRGSVWGDEKVLEADGDVGCATG